MDSTLIYPSIRELLLKLVSLEFILTSDRVFSMTTRFHLVRRRLLMMKWGILWCVLYLARSPPNDDGTREGNPPILPMQMEGITPLSPVLACSSLAHGKGGGKITSPLLLMLMTKGDLPPTSPCCFCSQFHFDKLLMAISFIFST